MKRPDTKPHALALIKSVIGDAATCDSKEMSVFVQYLVLVLGVSV